MTPKISSRLSAEARQEDSTNPKAAARLAVFLAATDHVLTLRWPADREVRLGAHLLADAPVIARLVVVEVDRTFVSRHREVVSPAVLAAARVGLCGKRCSEQCSKRSFKKKSRRCMSMKLLVCTKKVILFIVGDLQVAN